MHPFQTIRNLKLPVLPAHLHPQCQGQEWHNFQTLWRRKDQLGTLLQTRRAKVAVHLQMAIQQLVHMHEKPFENIQTCKVLINFEGGNVLSNAVSAPPPGWKP